jgi:hypothetical protein
MESMMKIKFTDQALTPDLHSMHPDQLDDPKQHLLSVIRKKGRRRKHREMLPQGAAPIGPRYNEVLCDFVEGLWDPERASEGKHRGRILIIYY